MRMIALMFESTQEVHPRSLPTTSCRQSNPPRSPLWSIEARWRQVEASPTTVYTGQTKVFDILQPSLEPSLLGVKSICYHE